METNQSDTQVDVDGYLETLESGGTLPSLPPAERCRIVEAFATRLKQIDQRIDEFLRLFDQNLPYSSEEWYAIRGQKTKFVDGLRDLLRKELPLTRDQLFSLVEWAGWRDRARGSDVPVSGVAKAVECFLAKNESDDEIKAAVGKFCESLRANTDEKGMRKYADRLTELLGAETPIPLEQGEAWSDQAIKDLKALPNNRRDAWAKLMEHALATTGGKPSAKWLALGASSVAAIGEPEFERHLVAWFPLVDRPRTQPLQVVGLWQVDPNIRLVERHVDVLRGLAWLAADSTDANLARALSALAQSSYRKVPGLGPRATRLGNAAVYALGQMPCRDALAQLALLKVKIKFGTALKEIDKALSSAAEREGLPREEIEEMAVPGYGLTEVGKRVEQLGEYRVELAVTGTTSTELRWFKADGKQQKSAPSVVKEQRAEDLNELKTAAKDVEKMLPAQRDRIDQLYLEQKTWAYSTWIERYLNHPLVGTLGRRLIWEFDHGEGRSRVPATWLDGQLVDAAAKPVSVDESTAIVSLWHPIGHSTDDVQAWRRFFEEREIRQPFKQAHREVYLLADAERNSRVYSNRYAAHVIRQHQFNALCGIRGWKNKLRLMVDDEYPPATRELAQWNLRAEFWVEGAGDNYGVDTNESGTFLYLITDQVRFYAREAARTAAHASGGGYGTHAAAPGANQVNEPLPLDEIPPLVFSEIMRDVDLFVGVASVGNNPEWQDGGPDGRYRDYWNQYSFGDLSGTAQSRKEVLGRLIPRLKIADRCRLEDRFIVVRGDRRTYKIHLGSGNILMEPNDQYLCIVPSRGQAAVGSTKVFLPFEGDERLAVILSKAFLLAEDTKITDASILSQIGR